MSAAEIKEKGRIEYVEGHGIWVPDGMDGTAILKAASLLEDHFGAGLYEAVLMVTFVWRTIAEASCKDRSQPAPSHGDGPQD